VHTCAMHVTHAGVYPILLLNGSQSQMLYASLADLCVFLLNW
jgi:hypothetical protein